MKQYFQWISWILQCVASLAQPTHTASSVWHFVQICAGIFHGYSFPVQSAREANILRFAPLTTNMTRSLKAEQNSQESSVKTPTVSVMKPQNCESNVLLPGDQAVSWPETEVKIWDLGLSLKLFCLQSSIEETSQCVLWYLQKQFKVIAILSTPKKSYKNLNLLILIK